MMKKSKTAILMILVTIIALAAPVSAYVSTQNIDRKAERMVDIADQALETVMDLVATIEADNDAMQAIADADLEADFYGNVSLCVEAGTELGDDTATDDGEGWTYLQTANASLLAEEYEYAIDNATEALTIFRDVLTSINVILVDAGVETEQTLDTEVIQEAIDRSTARILELEALIKDEEMLEKLSDASDLLTAAQEALDAGETQEAQDNLRDANALISEVCQDLKEIAQELNPSRVQNYLNDACQYQERFKERFGHAWDEEIDVDTFLQRYGYENEEDFMNRFQEMLENAQDAEDIEDTIQCLNEIGNMIRGMDESLTQEVNNHRAHHGGQEETTSGSGYGQESGSGYGQEGSGNSGSQYGSSGSGSGNMGSGSNN
ncbi:MAG: hypothetical protein NWF06_01305 [Candidatus Bathyarchaeota archaeon]|nr:hypothetical protein [Candidatus Bathyarchaeum sp.]